MTPVFDLMVAPELRLPLKPSVTGYTRSQETPMTDSYIYVISAWSYDSKL